MKVDDTCQPVCNTEECGWDNLKCSCAAGCATQPADHSDIGGCKCECMNPSCNYDSNDDATCDKEYLRVASFYHHITSK
jgi:hypothetical protein